MKNIEVKLINPLEYEPRVLELLKQLNPEMDLTDLKHKQREMTSIPNYACFGLFLKGELMGISSGWTTVRVYCGKQLELDNVIIDNKQQSKGFGNYFMEAIKEWSLENKYQSIGLNTYVQNARSHKFYFNEGFKILGFHFEQRLL